jgi:hypothetical protein
MLKSVPPNLPADERLRNLGAVVDAIHHANADALAFFIESFVVKWGVQHLPLNVVRAYCDRHGHLRMGGGLDCGRIAEAARLGYWPAPMEIFVEEDDVAAYEPEAKPEIEAAPEIGPKEELSHVLGAKGKGRRHVR